MEGIMPTHPYINMYQEDEEDILDEFLDSRMYSDNFVKVQESTNHPVSQAQNAFQHIEKQQLYSFQPQEKQPFVTPPEFTSNDLDNQTNHANVGSTNVNGPITPQSDTNNLNLQLADEIGDFNMFIKQESVDSDMMDVAIASSINNNNNYRNMNNNTNNNNNLSPQTANIKSEEFERFEISRNELMKLKFGSKERVQPNGLSNEQDPEQTLEKTLEKMCHISSPIDQKYIDSINDKSLPYKLEIKDVPSISRVETQMKLQLTVSPAPPQFLLRLPSDTISKAKLNLEGEIPESLKPHVLTLEVYVIGSNDNNNNPNSPTNSANSPDSTVNNGNSPNEENNNNSNESKEPTVKAEEDNDTKYPLSEMNVLNSGNLRIKSYNVCKRCIRRELKRAARKKNGTSDDCTNWLTGSPKRAIIFNCKEIVSFPRPTVDDPIEKTVDLMCRVICYCRHHHESKGFKLFFILKDHNDQILGQTISSPIMIMDRKKSTKNDGSDAVKSSVENGNASNNNTANNNFTNNNTNNNNNNNTTIDGNVSGEANNSKYDLDKDELDKSFGKSFSPSMDESSSDFNAFYKNDEIFNSNTSFMNKSTANGTPVANNITATNNNNANNTVRNNKRQKRPLSPTNYDLSCQSQQPSRLVSRNSSVASFQNGSTSNGIKREFPISPVSSDHLSSPQNIFGGSGAGGNSSGSVFSATPERLNYHSSTSTASGTAFAPQYQSTSGKNGATPSPGEVSNDISASVTSALFGSNMNSAVVNNSSNTNLNNALSNLPTIQRIIPAQGPIRGGIEVTLLGTNFRPGLTVKFGSNLALATHCWSESTIVTYLPPAAQAGPVLVTFIEDVENSNRENVINSSSKQIFTYTDDSDRQLIELALQIVGLKMNGKLEDAKNIAKRIIGNNNNGGANDTGDNNSANTSVDTNNNSNTDQYMNSNKYNEWLAEASDKLTELTQSNLHYEDILLKLLSMLQLPNSPISTPNWGLCTTEGQTMLHLACLKGYIKLSYYLLNHGSKTDYRDLNDFTPFQLALVNGNRQLVQLLIRFNSNTSLNIKNGMNIKSFADSNVLDLIQNPSDRMRRSVSNDSLSSMSSILEENDIHMNNLEIEEEPKFAMVQKSGLLKTDFFGDDDNDDDDDYSDFADNEENDDDDDDFNSQADSGFERKNSADGYEDNEEDEEEEEDTTIKVDVSSSSSALSPVRDEHASILKKSSKLESRPASKPIGATLWLKMKKAFNYKPNLKIGDEDIDSSGDSTDVNNNELDNETEREDNEASSTSATIRGQESPDVNSANGIAFEAAEDDEDDDVLPSYDDLFPNPASFRALINFRGHDEPKVEKSSGGSIIEEEGTGISTGASQIESSSSSMMLTGADDSVVEEEAVFDKYVGNSKITFKRDIRLMVFWLPFMLVLILLLLGNTFGLFGDASTVGKTYNDFASSARGMLGNIMLGKARVERLFNNVNDAVMTAVAGAGAR